MRLIAFLLLLAAAARAQVAFVYGAAPHWQFYDSAIDAFAPQEKPVAGIDAAGAPFGDPALVARILRRREYMIQAIGEGIADMNREMTEGKKKNEIIADLRRILDGKLNEAADADRRDCFRSVYEPAIRGVTGTLRDGPMPVMPYQALQRQISLLQKRRAAIVAMSGH